MKSLEDPEKAEYRITMTLEFYFWYPKELNEEPNQDSCVSVFIIPFSPLAKCYEQTKYPSVLS